MSNLAIAFKSRNELYSFARILKSNNILFQIINSPKSIASACTLSIKTHPNNLNKIKNFLIKHQPSSFIGLYLLSENQTMRLM